MEKKWTKGQNDAINSLNGTILVSAAAGSGKTAVLVQRVINRLTDNVNRIDADELLIVTFTKAAAEQMRERISSEISSMLEDNPDNDHLKRQQILLNSAHISTIHSFCGDLIREFFYEADVSADFRIAEAFELLVLKEEAIKNVLNKLYDDANPHFLESVEFFSSHKNDDGFIHAVFSVYEFISSFPFPKTWMKEKLSMYKDLKRISENRWADVIFAYADEIINHCLNLSTKSLDLLNKDEKLKNAYYESFLSDNYMLKTLDDLIHKKDWNKIYNLLSSLTFLSLKPVRGYSENPIKIKVCANRDSIKACIKKVSSVFIVDEETVTVDSTKLLNTINILFNTVILFDEEFKKLKSEKNILDFSDLEHTTLKILTNETEDGYKKSDIALEVSERFKEIMVDEYQDTNQIQDTIFKVLSQSEENLFMVGDVKQSIYGFRQSEPRLFLGRKEAYKTYSSELNKYPAKIILDGNFRSRQTVVDSVNFVFSQIMSRDVGDVEYTDNEKLLCLADYADNKESRTELALIDLSDQEEDTDTLEARYIASYIKKLIDNKYLIKDGDTYRPINYGDFCILLRNFNGHCGTYVKELKAASVPTISETSETFLDSSEVNVILSFLNVIDNPISDIPLISVLMSPIYAFSPDKLADIRSNLKDESLYFALRNAADKNDEDVLKFFSHLYELNELSVHLPTYRLILEILDRTGYTAMVQTMTNKEVRLSNLRLLVDYAKNYEKFEYTGLSSFLYFIDKLKKNKSTTSSGKISFDQDFVKLMSIHKSKGLEFPVCILAGCSRKFNRSHDDIMLSSNLGIGLKFKDTEKMVKYDTFTRKAVCIETEKFFVSEELRILYVAMTRAKEKLLMVASLKDVKKTLCKLWEEKDNKISPYTVRNSKSFLDWILLCLNGDKSISPLIKEVAPECAPDVRKDSGWNVELIYASDVAKADKELPMNAEPFCGEYNHEDIAKIVKEIEKKINFEYPGKELIGIPSKITAAQMSQKLSNFSCDNLKRPSFAINGKTGLLLTPAQKGTAMHKFLQFLDFKNAATDINLELDRLTKNGFLSPEQCACINISKMEKFLSSNLIRRISLSNRVEREYQFTVDAKVSDFGFSFSNEQLNNEMVIVQGAIDLFFEDNGELVIIDYKTDKNKTCDELTETYKNQLHTYKLALEKCTNKRVKECIIYSFNLNREIYVDI